MKNNTQKLGAEYRIEQPSDQVKKINFYTSTCFEGCDIYDEQGKTFIVSDGGKSHTLLDISTLFVQICGRIRNSIYKTDIVHIYSTTKYSREISLEQFVEATKRTLNEAENFADEVNRMSDVNRIKLLGKLEYINEKYVRIEDNKIIVDKNLANLDIVNFKICRHIYRTYITLNNELINNGYNISVHSFTDISLSERLEENPKAKISFKELFIEYCKLIESQYTFSLNVPDLRISAIENINPLVKVSYNKLGRKEVERLNYNQTNIKRELLKIMNVPLENKIVALLNSDIEHQVAIPVKMIKEKLQKAYDNLGIEQKAKATDLNK